MQGITWLAEDILVSQEGWFPLDVRLDPFD
jgi:hypothetical protein